MRCSPAMPDDPRIRASHVQGTLQTLARRAPDELERVLARLDPLVHAGLCEALKGSYVPAAWDVALVEAMHAELGAAGTRAILRGMMNASLAGPLLGGLLRTAQTLFGRSPGGLLRWAGHAYAHVTRQCGTVTVEREAPEEVRLVLDGMPASLASPRYLDAIVGAIEAIFDLCRVEGSVAVLDARRTGATYLVTWRQRG